MTTRLLIVDDEENVRTSLQDYFQREGYQVEIAEDGPTGIRLAQELNLALIILDVELPGMSGFDVCKALKAVPKTESVPIVMLTRHDTPESLGQGLDAGAVDYIPKDVFADAVLLKTLEQMELLG